MMEKDIELEKLRNEIAKGTVCHRRCDICGCELAMPDVGLYSREVLNTVSCTACTNTKALSILLRYVEDLRKTCSKQEILKILDERMIETWGGEASVFTFDEFKEQFMTPTNCGTMGAGE